MSKSGVPIWISSFLQFFKLFVLFSFRVFLFLFFYFMNLCFFLVCVFFFHCCGNHNIEFLVLGFGCQNHEILVFD